MGRTLEVRSLGAKTAFDVGLFSPDIDSLFVEVFAARSIPVLQGSLTVYYAETFVAPTARQVVGTAVDLGRDVASFVGDNFVPTITLPNLPSIGLFR